jgi:hypothetical protein
VEFTSISCHFGDPFWITNTVKHIDEFSDARIATVIIVDQDRGSAGWLSTLPRVSQVIDFPVDEHEVQLLGHDHPASLNRALRSIEVSTSHILILDSDCFPIDSGWLDVISNVTVASDPHYWSLSHPCLMALPSEARSCVDFSQGIAETGIDTGRLVALQLAQSGFPVTFTHPTPAFRGYRGHFYLNGSAYHHGSASFAHSSDERLVRQVNAEREPIFRNHVERGEYDFARGELANMRVRGALRRARARLKV